MTAPQLPSDAADGPITGDDYNYAAFSFALKPTGLEHWLTAGPKPGETAPDFRLEAVDGTSVRLRELRGRPVVLEFGSYTCPVFCAHIEPMEAIARRHPEAAFFVLYTREAHPGEAVPRHWAMADKRQAARRLLADEPIRRTVLIDDVAGTVHRAYGQAWDSVYVIDPGGTIVLRQAWTNPEDVEAVLAGLAAGTRILPRQTTQMAPWPAGPWARACCAAATRRWWTFTRRPRPRSGNKFASRRRRRSSRHCWSSHRTTQPMSPRRRAPSGWPTTSRAPGRPWCSSMA
jgi:Iodothyronine deiodinase